MADDSLILSSDLSTTTDNGPTLDPAPDGADAAGSAARFWDALGEAGVSQPSSRVGDGAAPAQEDADAIMNGVDARQAAGNSAGDPDARQVADDSPDPVVPLSATGGRSMDTGASSDVDGTTVRLGALGIVGATPAPQPLSPDSDGKVGVTAADRTAPLALDVPLPNGPITAPSTATYASSDAGGVTVRLGAATLPGTPPVTADQLRAIMPHAGAAADLYAGPLSQAMAAHGINTPAQRAAFLAQVSVESNQLHRTAENLYYTTAQRLQKVFGSSFFPTPASAVPYLRKPEALANYVYAPKNGNEEDGDGYRYRGRGLIQVTGRGNYRDVGFENNPEALEEPDGAAHSAAGWWQNRGLNGRTAGTLNRAEFDNVSRVINRYDPNLQERWNAYQRALHALDAGQSRG
jgi:predicted chitinase